MASQKNFAITPSVSISRCKLKRPFTHKTSFNLGELVPVYVDADILPGDTVSMDLSTLVRMSTPIVPIMDNIYIDYYAFFVPNRLLWNDWKKFMGENDTAAGAVTSEPSFPVASIAGGYSMSNTRLGAYMGLPCGLSGSGAVMNVSALPGRAYLLCYTEWFRDQNLVTPIVINRNGGQSNSLGNNGIIYFQYDSPLLKVAKESDYFTRSLPYAQKGSPVKLPLGDTAPVKVGPLGVVTLATATGTIIDGPLTVASSTNNESILEDNSGDTIKTVGGLVTDLSTATAATINQLRFAFQYQKFLEKDALYGTRYWEILKGHFGVVAPDASLQRPELLGHFRQYINIDQVLQTSATSTSGTALGTPGANSVSGTKGSLVSKSFVEHGVLLVLACARHNQTYGQGVNRMWTRVHRTDFYFPVFANLGAQEVKNKEIFATGNATSDNGTFGFQEAWAEYRYKPDIVTGILNPSIANSLGFWTLANNFSQLPTLSQSFIEQDRGNLARALTTGNSGPDFICDFYFDCTYVRPMPLYSIPGLIDHH